MLFVYAAIPLLFRRLSRGTFCTHPLYDTLRTACSCIDGNDILNSLAASGAINPTYSWRALHLRLD